MVKVSFSNLNRRAFLGGAFITAALTAIASDTFRNRRIDQESQGVKLSFDSHNQEIIEGDAIAPINLTRPTVPYNRQISHQLALFCLLGTEQYLQGLEDDDYNGDITVLEDYDPELDRYEQRMALSARKKNRRLEYTLLEAWAKRLTPNLVPEITYFGFILESDEENIIVIRGTQEPEEWLLNLRAGQTPYRPNDPSLGYVHQGFSDVYDGTKANLSTEFHRVLRQLDWSKPLYIAGHSLGGAFAIFIAIALAELYPELKPNIRVYSFGSPRVGDLAFAEYYSQQVPNSYRVVNLTDITPLLPPSRLGNYRYVHVGEEWAFVYQSGDISPNHQLAGYIEATGQGIERATPGNSPLLFRP